MKLVDLDYHDSIYNMMNDVKPEIAKLHFPQKYLRLVAADGSVYDLEIVDVTDKEFYVKIEDKIYDPIQ